MAEVQRRIDNNRRAYFSDSCVALGMERDQAAGFADLAILILAGSQNLGGPVDRQLVARAADALHTQVLAALPKPAPPR